MLALATVLLTGCERYRTVSPAGMHAYELSAADLDGVLAVAWHGGDEGRDAIYLRLATASGAAGAGPWQLTDGSRAAYEPDLESLQGDALLAWYEKDAKGALTAYAGRFDREGHRKWLHELSGPGQQGRNPVVRVHGDEVWASWIETPPGSTPVVRAARLSSAGNFTIVPRTAGNASVDTWNLNAACDDNGSLLVVYDAHDGTRAKELRLLRIGADSLSQVALSNDDGFDSEYPDLAWHDGHVALTWFDRRDGNAEVYLFVGADAKLAGGVDSHARRITHTPGESIGAYVAWNGEKGALAWSDADSAQHDIYLQLFDAHGAPVGEARRLTRTATESLIPSIRPWHRGFAIAWNEQHAGREPPPTLASEAMLEVVP